MNLDSIKRNSNDFSFSFSLGNLINNRKFKEGHDEYFQNKETEKSFIWKALSAIGDDIGSVIYENILNYIDNVSNINTCKLKPLTSIAKILGITEFGILKNIDDIPLEILNVLDILSINKNYLLNSGIASNELKNIILSYAPSNLSADVNYVSFGKEINNIYINNSFEDQSLISASISLYTTIKTLQSSESNIKNFIKKTYTEALTAYELKKQYEDFANEIVLFYKANDLNYDDIELELNDNAMGVSLVQEINNLISNIKYNNNSLNKVIEENCLSNFNFVNYSDLNKYRYFVYDTFYNVLTSNVFMTYGDKGTELENDYIINNISNDIYSLRMTDWNSLLSSEIDTLMREFNIDPGFNYFGIANDIHNGKDSIDNYSFGEQLILKTELDARSKTKFTRNSSTNPYNDSEKLYTRFSYYREYKVKEFFYFIEKLNYEYAVTSSDSDNSRYINVKHTNIYDLDNTYSVLNEFPVRSSLLDNIIETTEINKTLSSDPLFILKPAHDQIESLRFKLIKNAANILTDLAFAIVGIREQLKTQSQRNYMTGTSLLITYIINEYLRKNLALQYPELKQAVQSKHEYNPNTNTNGFGSEIIEYLDITEYYNISSDVHTDKVLYKDSVNNRYWTDTENFSSITGKTLYKNDVEKFYLSTLNVKTAMHGENNIYDFLNAIYEMGANKSYLTNDGLSTIVPSYQIDNIKADGIHYTKDHIEHLSAYQNEIFLKYHGNDIAYFPYYNHKNVTHPSRQLHPYLFNFVEYSNATYPIYNAFNNDANENLIRILTTAEISSVLGNFGNILNIWNNNTLDYSGYRSRYEDSAHSMIGNLGYVSPVTNYDGTFYPPALDDYVKAINDNKLSDLLSSVAFQSNYDKEGKPTFYNKYYSHLDLSEDITKYIANQLSTYKDDILDIAILRDTNDSQYDIFKYCLDNYLNSFILYKKYPLSTSYDDKKNTRGCLWFRFNNHPIGFPAFTGKLPQITLSTYYAHPHIKRYIDKAISYSLKTPLELSNELSSFINKDAFLSGVLTSNLSSNVYRELSSASIIYDMDIDQLKGHISFAVENFEDSRLRSYEDSIVCYCRTQELIAYESIQYILESPILLKKSDFSTDNYKFKGFYQSDDETYAVYLRVNNSLTAFKIIVVSFSFYRDVYVKYNSKWILFDDFNVKNPIIENSNFIIGFANNLFTIAFLTSLENTISARTYVGENVNDKSNKCGYTNYLCAQVDVDNEYNSADRFSTYITTIDFNELYLKDRSFYKENAKSFNLNSDASYVSLYAGRAGALNLWDTNKKEYESDDKSYSIELLGLSYNKIQDDIEDKEDEIIDDPDDPSIQTEIGADDILSAAMRVYENYNASEYLYTLENRALRPQLSNEYSLNKYLRHYTRYGIDFTIDSKDIKANDLVLNDNNIELSAIVATENDTAHEYSYTFNPDEHYYITRKARFLLHNSISSDECLSNYMVLVYNAEAGAKYPIIAGELSYDRFSDENIHYISSDSPIDEYIKEHGYRPNEFVNTVGTTAFKEDISSIIDPANTNHILNIRKITAELIFDENIKQYYVQFKLYQNKYPNDFVINTGNLVMYVYLKNSLGQFTDYHYLEPFDLWPFNALYTVSADKIENALSLAQRVYTWQGENKQFNCYVSDEKAPYCGNLPEYIENKIVISERHNKLYYVNNKTPPPGLPSDSYDFVNDGYIGSSRFFTDDQVRKIENYDAIVSSLIFHVRLYQKPWEDDVSQDNPKIKVSVIANDKNIAESISVDTTIIPEIDGAAISVNNDNTVNLTAPYNFDIPDKPDPAIEKDIKVDLQKFISPDEIKIKFELLNDTPNRIRLSIWGVEFNIKLHNRFYGAKRGLTNPEMDRIVLYGLSSFDQVPELSSNQITFKTSEENIIGPFDKYPTTILDDTLFNKFKSINKDIHEVDNARFSLSNTYIFKLEPPEHIEESLGKIGIKVYSVNQEFGRAHEDFILSQYYIDECGPEVLEYCHFFSDGQYVEDDFIPDPNQTPSDWFIWENIDKHNVRIKGLVDSHKIFKKEPILDRDTRPHDVLIWVDSSMSMEEEVVSIRNAVSKLSKTLTDINPENRVAIITGMSQVSLNHVDGLSEISKDLYKVHEDVLITKFTNKESEFSKFTKFLHRDNLYLHDGSRSMQKERLFNNNIYIGEDPTIIIDAFKQENLFNVDWRISAKDTNGRIVPVLKTIILISDETYDNYPEEPGNTGPWSNINRNEGKYPKDTFINVLKHENAEIFFMYTQSDGVNQENDRYYLEIVDLLKTYINKNCKGYTCKPEDAAIELERIFIENLTNKIRYFYADGTEETPHYVDYDLDLHMPEIPEFNIIVPYEIEGGKVKEISKYAFKNNIAFRNFTTQKYLTSVKFDIFDRHCDDLEIIDFRDPHITAEYIKDELALISVEDLPDLRVKYHEFDEDLPEGCSNTEVDDFQLSTYDIYPFQDISTINDCCALLSSHGYYRAYDEKSDASYVTKIFEYEVTKEKIESFIKLYVNYSIDKDTGEIILYFNYNNFFNSPYLYKKKNGSYQTLILPKSYLQLKSGESGDLDIILQFKYFDDIGILCGIETKTVVSYKIWNVSDDKPKFVIFKTWEINNSGSKHSIDSTMPVYINVAKTLVPSYINDDNLDTVRRTTLFDVSAETSINVISEIPLKNIKCKLLYEIGEDYSFELLSSNAMISFKDDNGLVDTEFDRIFVPVNCNLKSGTYVGKEDKLVFPIKIISADVTDINGNHPSEIYFTDGSVTYDFGSSISHGTYLAKEHPSFGGFVLEEISSSLFIMFEEGAGALNANIATVNDIDPEKDLQDIITGNNVPLVVELTV